MANGVRPRLIMPSMGIPETDASFATADKSAGRRRWLVVAALSLLAIVIAHLGDAWAWSHMRDARVYERDWGRMLRSAGYLPTWLIVAIGLYTHDRGTRGDRWRGGLMVLVPTLAGGAAEVLKLVFRRLRPGETSSAYVFRPYLEDTWSNRGMGMPSSHMMVAMGAAVVLARLYPRASWLWYLIAIGCGCTRILAGAHYLSDVVVAAVAAWIIGDLLMRWGLRRRAA